MPRIPLRHRVPNPPPHFVGREDAQRALASALRPGRVVCVTGPGGIGKSTLVCATLRNLRSELLERGIFVRVPDEGDDVLAPLLRALERVDDETTLEWDVLSREPDAAIATAIELADAHELLVVLDDLHLADEADPLLTLVARYSRQARWIATSRTPIGDEHVVSVPLGPMSEESLRSLAAALDVPDENTAHVAARAAGSPLALRQIARGVEPDTDATDVLGVAARGLVSALAELRRPQARALLAELADDDVLETLIEAGLAVDLGGVTLHDAVRESLERDGRAAPAESDARLDPERLLEEGTDPEQWLGALEILARRRDVDGLQRALARTGHTLVEGGYAAEVDRLLEQLADDADVEAADRRALAPWLDLCRLALGRPPVADRLDALPGDDPRSLLPWVHYHYESGDYARVVEAIDETMLTDSPPDVAFELRYARARCVANLGDLDTAMEAVEALEPTDADQRARKLTTLARMRHFAGADLEDVQALLQQVAHDELTDVTACRCALERSQILTDHGAFSAARRVLDEALERQGRRALLSQAGRRLIIFAAEVASAAGRLDRAKRLTAEVRPYFRADSFERTWIALDAAFRARIRGDFLAAREVLEGRQARLAAMPESSGYTARLASAIAHEMVELDIAEARPLGAVTHRHLDDSDDPLMVLAALEHALRFGERSRAPCIDDATRPYLVGRVEALRALAALRAGEADRAVAHARGAVRWAVDAGFRSEALELRALLVDTLCVAADITAARRELEHLQALADDIGSARFRMEADVARAMVATDFAADVLPRVADAHETSPRAARRARCMLLGSQSPDHTERAVLRATMTVRGWQAASNPTDPRSLTEWQRGWGLDLAKRCVWSAETVIDMRRRHKQWQLLEALAEAGGEADKGRLHSAVTGQAEFHPLRDANRLRVLVHRVRSTLEEAAAAGIETTDEGYGLTGCWRVVRAL